MIGPVQVLFWGCLLVLLHPLILYPLSLLLVSATDGNNPSQPTEWPSVTLAIAAYNERAIIGTKLENSLALRYPGRLEVVVVDDGSTDGTADRAAAYADRGVDVLRVEGRVGKTACQNEVVAAVETDVVVFSDANSMYEPDAIRRLVARFGAETSCVVGNLRYHPTDRVAGEHAYWRFEQFLKRLEARATTAVTGTGAMYAVRRSSYVALPADAISDFELPLAVLEGGERVGYAPDAVAWERMSGSLEAELRRRVRISTRIWRSGFRRRALFNPLRQPLLAYQLLSHRVALAAAPLAFLGLFAAALVSVLTGGSSVAAGVVGLQIGFCLFAGLGALGHMAGARLPLALEVPYYLSRSGLGMLSVLTTARDGNRYTTWDTLERSGEHADPRPSEAEWGD